jgi:coenzyme Q-binding protein COQ10
MIPPMPTHRESRIVPYTPEQMFALVAEVERYPEFLPWCRAVRVWERGEGWLTAEMTVAFAAVTERYTSHVRLTPPQRVAVTQQKGVFHHLENRWEFVHCAEGTRVEFFLDFSFRSRLPERMLGKVFAHAAEKMTQAFLERAQALYGSVYTDSISIRHS